VEPREIRVTGSPAGDVDSATMSRLRDGQATPAFQVHYKNEKG
jgi:hypothetical protein